MTVGQLPPVPEEEPSEPVNSDGDQAVVALGMIESWAADLAVEFQNPLPEWTTRQHCEALADVQEARRLLADAEQGLKNSIGTLMGGRTFVIPDYGVLTRSKRKSRTQWDKDALLSAVLDSRLVLDKDTGEIKDESPLDRVLHVWNLGAPRTTALRDRGIDADEFAQVEEKPGWDVRVESSDA